MNQKHRTHNNYGCDMMEVEMSTDSDILNCRSLVKLQWTKCKPCIESVRPAVMGMKLNKLHIQRLPLQTAGPVNKYGLILNECGQVLYSRPLTKFPAFVIPSVCCTSP